jgi:hypothetical protein
MTLERKTPKETGYDTVTLTAVKIGDQAVGLTRSEQLLHIAGEDWNLERWQTTVERVERLLISERWIAKPKKTIVSNGQQSSDFLTNNVQAIIEQKRGRMKPAPFWLRWFCDAVITNDRL